jgi:hypothetical protein
VYFLVASVETFVKGSLTNFVSVGFQVIWAINLLDIFRPLLLVYYTTPHFVFLGLLASLTVIEFVFNGIVFLRV